MAQQLLTGGNGTTGETGQQVRDKINQNFTELYNIFFNRQTASYTLVLTDKSKTVEMNVAIANNLTIPLNSTVPFDIGTEILLAQYGAGQTTVMATVGVTIRSADSALKLRVRYSGATLLKVGIDEWYLFGDLTV